MAKAKRKAASILLLPDESWVRAARKKLPKFRPHDLRSLTDAAKRKGKADINKEVLLEFRRRNKRQLVDLLRTVGVDPSRPDAWERGFFG